MPRRAELRIGRVTAVHPHAWLWEPLEDEASFTLRSMFGTKVVYLDEKLVLCFAAKAEPWRGVLVCTERAHHASLTAEIPALSVHPVLGKWLYLPEVTDDFERIAERIVRLVHRRDQRIGVWPLPKKKRKGRNPQGFRAD